MEGTAIDSSLTFWLMTNPHSQAELTVVQMKQKLSELVSRIENLESEVSNTSDMHLTAVEDF